MKILMINDYKYYFNGLTDDMFAKKERDDKQRSNVPEYLEFLFLTSWEAMQCREMFSAIFDRQSGRV